MLVDFQTTNLDNTPLPRTVVMDRASWGWPSLLACVDEAYPSQWSKRPSYSKCDERPQ